MKLYFIELFFFISDPTTRVPAGARKVNRAVGISAEPQSLKNLQDLTTKTFPEFKKEKK